ncbi:hypothetical protein H1224_08135 [Pectobacterium aroidearum]|uniref:hypothetical protein n=1 Tax=Pectobacterium aroidearum TaxID=1201031 RepID=UPI0015F73D22|nr:hypothetical protein [Pectobacterium aroidearum]MBA5601023.1 hypothetical protein [Pectobacterium aroidearum]
MKPEMSTAVMIERLRALIPDSQDGSLLNQVANRIELLLEAESGMSREMACIRHALDIPPDQSVQSGVVDAFVRLNGEILELRNRLVAYDRAAKDPVYQYQSGICNDENGETDWYWDDCDKGFYDQYVADRRRILYAAPPLPVVPDELTYQGAKELFNYLMTEEETNATVNGFNACRYEMLQLSGNPVWSGIDWAKGCEPTKSVPEGWALVPIDATRKMIDAAIAVDEDGYDAMHKAMIAAAPQLERKDGDA